jgi:hypothetical protein
VRFTGALVASAMLTACAVSAPDNPAATAPAPKAYRPGSGIIESASVVSLSSSAGATAGATSTATMAYRLKMADGTMQDVVQQGERFELGEQVRLTGDGRLVRP